MGLSKGIAITAEFKVEGLIKCWVDLQSTQSTLSMLLMQGLEAWSQENFENLLS